MTRNKHRCGQLYKGWYWGIKGRDLTITRSLASGWEGRCRYNDGREPALFKRCLLGTSIQRESVTILGLFLAGSRRRTATRGYQWPVWGPEARWAMPVANRSINARNMPWKMGGHVLEQDWQSLPRLVHRCPGRAFTRGSRNTRHRGSSIRAFPWLRTLITLVGDQREQAT